MAIARAIVTDPTIIVADEPTGDLDAESAKSILHLLGQLNRDGHKTIVMVTHDAGCATHAKRILRLEKGQLISTNGAPARPAPVAEGRVP